VPPAGFGRLAARLRFRQDPDDLLFREPFPTDRGTLPAGILGQILTLSVAQFLGSRSHRDARVQEAREVPSTSEEKNVNVVPELDEEPGHTLQVAHEGVVKGVMEEEDSHQRSPSERLSSWRAAS
jgi:hypothetical protein